MSKWNQKWLFCALIPPSSAAARHLVPTCPPQTPPPQGAAGPPPGFQQCPSLSHTLLKEGIVCTKGRVRIARYKSELLSDK